MTAAETFWARVDRSDDCWLWLGARNGRGYGTVRLDGRRMQATKAALLLTGTPVPDGMDICHRCDNPPCVRPDHLFVGDARANALDAAAKGRLKAHWTGKHLSPEHVARMAAGVRRARAEGRGPALYHRGEDHVSHKLTADQVRQVRADRAAGRTRTAIARDLGVARSTIYYILRGTTWRDAA